MKVKLRIGGVPEHFNLPWHLAIENDHFLKKGLEVEWITFPGGTGQMRQALRNNEVDVCVILTEGIIADIVKGSPVRIISQYINSPLIWGVHTGSRNDLKNYDEIYSKKYAISRFGSGSHLMAIVDAHSNKKVISEEQFIPIKNLNGAIESLSNLETDVFYWEKYMTKPYVDNGQLRRLGEYLTPWPSFVIAARQSCIEENRKELKDVLDVIRFNSAQFMRSPFSISEVTHRFELKSEDVEEWFHKTEWNTSNEFSSKIIDNVQFSLKNAGIIDEIISKDDILLNL